jgi:flagellin
VAEANVALDVDQVAAIGDIFSLDVADAAGATVSMTYTTLAAHEDIATILAGFQADTNYTGQSAAADGFTLSLGTDGESIDINYNGVGAAGAISLQSSATDPDTTAQYTATAGLFSVTGIDDAGSDTAVITITNVADVSNTGVGGDAVEVTLEDGTLTLTGSVSAGDEISFTLGSTAVSVTAYNTSLSDTASMLVSAINQNSGGSIIASLNDDGSIAVSNSSGSASVMSSEAALAALDNIDAAISTLNTQRANLGAISNRLDSTVNNLSNVSINLEAGRGRIEDADFAAESTAMSKAQILQQASTAMLAQANASKQNVLSLLQG